MFVTVAKDNGDLLRALTAKKVTEAQLAIFAANSQKLLDAHRQVATQVRLTNL